MQKIYLIGNPNVGKTTLFNTLTNQKEETGNYAGTTLGIKKSIIQRESEAIEIIDIPGMYGSKNPKEEEKISWESIFNAMEEENTQFIQVINPTQWEQSLSLSLELKKRGLPLYIFMNTKKEILSVDFLQKIEENLCCSVFSGNASEKTLKKTFWTDFENAKNRKNNRLCTLDEFDLLQKIKKYSHKKKENNQQNIVDQYLLHQIFGIFIFAGIMWAMFQMVFTLGSIPMNYIDEGFTFLSEKGKIFCGNSLLSLLFFDGIIAGVGATMMFVPNIILLFLGLSIMKDSGYLARSSYLLNSFFKNIGLSGRVSVPLLMGFGCNVPSIMAISTLENKKEKVAVAMMSLFMSCGARLPVYTLLIEAFIPSHLKGLTLFSIYFFGILIAFGTGAMINKIYPKNTNLLLIQIPQYISPSFKKAFSFAIMQAKDFFERVWKFIIPTSIILWGMFTFPLQEIEENGIEASYGAEIAKTIQPIFSPLGFDWTMTAGILAGISAKEVMISNFAQIYGQTKEHENLGDFLKTLPQFTIPSVFSLLIFTLLYMPCIAVIMTIKAQLGTKWAIVGAVYPTIIAWIFGTIVYWMANLFY